VAGLVGPARLPCLLSSDLAPAGVAVGVVAVAGGVVGVTGCVPGWVVLSCGIVLSPEVCNCSELTAARSLGGKLRTGNLQKRFVWVSCGLGRRALEGKDAVLMRFLRCFWLKNLINTASYAFDT
jgi:hypothetical protein